MVDATFEGVPPRMGGTDMASAPPPGPSNHRVDYRGGAGQVFRIALVNSLLSLLTLGIYRFWARTRLRRYFWSHVELDGDPVEYTGTGMQLFLGFLIVLAILVPLLFGLEYVATLFPQDAWEQAVIVLVQGFGFLFLIQYAVFRARRYRLRHTRWRGIRCNQTGSGRRYALRAFGYALLTLFTLGLAYPLFRVKTQRLLMNNTVLGSQAFSFDGSAGPLFKKWLLVWGATFAGIALIVLSADLSGTRLGPDGGYRGPLTNVPGVGSVAVIALLAVPLLYAWYSARELRYFAQVTRFGSLGFASALKTRQVLLIYAIYYLVLAVVAGIIFFVFSGFIAGFQEGLMASLGGTQEQQMMQLQGILILFGFVALLFAATLVSIIQPVLIMHPLARRVIGTLSLKGQYDMDALLQGAKTRERPGEGLADALDVDVAGF